MTANGSLLPLVFVCFIIAFASEPAASSDCTTVDHIETINKGVLEKRLAHIKGLSAIVFIALDPVWSKPDFVNIPYRHPADMAMIKKDFDDLVGQDIDEVIVWQFRNPKGLGAAVPFKNGCAVVGYGEPDLVNKLIIMNETYRLITERGLDDSSVRADIKRLLMLELEHYQDDSIYDDSMIDIMINKLRPLIANTKSSSSDHKHWPGMNAVTVHYL